MKIKTFISSIILLIVVFGGHAQTKEGAMRDAKLAAQGSMSADYESIIKYSLPEIIELMGGKEAAKTSISAMYKSMNEQGLVFEKAEILEVSDIVKEQGQSRCTVKSYNEMTMTGQRLKSTSYLLGIYNDEGEHWTFIEAKQLQTPQLVNQILPDFETSLDLPKDDVEIVPVKE
jgi:hypothetical protein